jgi:hypothetical protein
MNNRRPYGLLPFEAPEGWAKKSKVSHVFDKKKEEGGRLVGIRVTKGNGDEVDIPVVDATRSEDHRRLVRAIEKASNMQRGSKYFKPSYSVLGYSYNISRK